jgi:dCTP diphosphatase
MGAPALHLAHTPHEFAARSVTERMNRLQQTLQQFRDARNWQQYHTPANLARAIAVEAGELNALFLWDRRPDSEHVHEEVADVLIYCLNLCNAIGADAETLIDWKIEKNATRVVRGDGFVA